MSRNERLSFPFAAIVGQEQMKTALLLNIIDPRIGGVLIKGEKGTAKSTTVRSLIQVLPDVEHVKGCVYHCRPERGATLCPECAGNAATDTMMEYEVSPMKVVELPLSATEDRIAGTLDIEHMLQTGRKKFEPGVLAQANGNLLYIDEVNLLEDHMVDLLLDVAAMGVNYVEREGISFEHPSRFILVGSMNPEEGELRPQLIDRFGLCVEMVGEKSLRTRTEIVSRRLEFDDDPESFTETYAEATAKIRGDILRARRDLPNVIVSKDLLTTASNISIHFKMEGHRADITMVRAARANAALLGKDMADRRDLETVAPFVLSHRIRRRPFENTRFDVEELKKCI